MLTLVRTKCKNQTCAMKETRGPFQLEIFYSGGRRGVSMLRWGGSSPAPPAPQCMPSPNKLRSCSAALPPACLSFCSAPDRADLAQHKGRLSPACGQCHMAGWRRGEAAGPRPGAEGAEGPPLALRGQDMENCILGRPGAQSPRFVPYEVVVRVGLSSHLNSWV